MESLILGSGAGGMELLRVRDGILARGMVGGGVVKVVVGGGGLVEDVSLGMKTERLRKGREVSAIVQVNLRVGWKLVAMLM